MNLERVPFLNSPENIKVGESSLGNRIRTLRNELGLNQAKLAKNAGLSQGYTSQLEDDQVRPLDSKTAIGVAKALGTGLGFFEGIEDQKVFLRPEAQQIYQAILSEQIPQELKEIFVRVVDEIVPEIENSYTDIIHIDYIPSAKSLGQKIKEARQRRFLEQGNAARASKLSQGHFSQLESGDTKTPTLRTLKSIARTLNVRLEYLLDIKIVSYPQLIVRIDRFFRSSLVESDLRDGVRQNLNLLQELFTNPKFTRITWLLVKSLSSQDPQFSPF